MDIDENIKNIGELKGLSQEVMSTELSLSQRLILISKNHEITSLTNALLKLQKY